MNPFENSRTTSDNDSSLQEIIRRLLTNYQLIAAKHQSFFINNVPPDIKVIADKNDVTALLGSMLYMVARLCKDSCIKITAKAYHDVILLHIQDSNTVNGYTILSELAPLQALMSKIGGFVELTSQRKKVSTIAFSFINRKELPGSLDETEITGKNELNSLRA
jgi:UTP-glucose-1-phosphate uridylyltransferase